MINNFPYRQVTGQDRFAGKFCQAFREETIPTIYKFFKKIKAEKICSYVTLALSYYQNQIDITRKGD